MTPDIPDLGQDVLMTVQEMIYTAFDGRHNNRVHFKLLQTILYILAQQLRILDRRVEVSVARYGTFKKPRESNIRVEEIQVMTKVAKKGRPSISRTSLVDFLEPGKSKLDKTRTETASSLGRRSLTGNTPSTRSETSSTHGGAVSDTDTSGKATDGATTSGAAASGDPDSSAFTTEAATSGAAAFGRAPPGTAASGAATSGVAVSDPASKGAASSAATSGTLPSGIIGRGTDGAMSKVKPTETIKPHNIMGITSSSSSDKVTGIAKVDPGMTVSDTSRQTETSRRSTIQSHAGSTTMTSVLAAPAPPKPSKVLKKEKVLVVGQTGPDGQRISSTTPLAVVTLEEFLELQKKVQELEDKFFPKGKEGSPNLDLMMELRRPSTITDAIAGLHMAAKLDTTEKTLAEMTEVITGLARRSGLNVVPDFHKVSDKDVETLYENASVDKESGKKEEKTKKGKKKAEIKPDLPAQPAGPRASKILANKYAKRRTTLTDDAKKGEEAVTYKELGLFMTEFSKEIMEATESILAKNKESTDNAVKMSGQLDMRLKAYLNLGKKMEDVEALVNDYADKVTVLDTSLASQMTNYQEQLTQMQHDLEAGIENMAEAVANIGGDTTAIAELNTHFNILQLDVDHMTAQQKEFQETQNLLVCDTQDLWHQVEFLKAAKSDREEVEDALRDKAGIEMLNGLVTRDQFTAVHGDFIKRIGNAYSLFNQQEHVWQKMIDDVMKDLNEKAEADQLISLRESVNEHCANLHNRLDFMSDIIGEPNTAALTRRIHRNAVCISCSSPAHMVLEEPSIPTLPAFKPKTMGAAAQDKPRESGDHTLLCYPGRKIRHPLNRRAQFCSRYCGGSHTVVPNLVTRAPLCAIVNPLSLEADTALGTDGKVYKIDELLPRPCRPCNPAEKCQSIQTSTGLTKEAKVSRENMTPSDYYTDAAIGHQNPPSNVTPPMIE